MKRIRHRFLVQDRVRTALEILEPDSTGMGFRLAVLVYGDNKDEAEARAELIAEWLTLEGARAHMRKRMRQASVYAWARRMYRQKRQPQAFYELLVWLLGVVVDTDTVAQWLKEEFGE